MKKSKQNGPNPDELSFVRLLPILLLIVCFAALVFTISSARRKREAQKTPAAVEAKPAEPATNEAKPFVIPASNEKPPVTQFPREKVEYAYVAADKLLERFSALQGVTNTLTLEQIKMVNETLDQLIAQGAESVPAIAAYLESLTDFYLQSHGMIGQPTVRAALIEALFEIGAPEATEAMAKTLQGAADPYEIGLLANFLDQRSLGLHRNDVIEAARDAFAMAQRGELPGRDVAPLFVALQNSGVIESKGQIEATGTEWSYYASMALAGLPDGSGISTLVQRAQEAGAGDTAEGRFAWQLLAQYSGQSAEAQSALLNAAEAKKVPAGAWAKIITGLTGDQYMYGDSRTGGPRLNTTAGLKTYHIRVGNQNFYSLPLATLNPPDMPARRSVIDALLRLDLPADAQESLRQARNTLSGVATSH